MPRVYYKEEKLSGKPFRNSIINMESFDFILKNSSTNSFDIIEFSSSAYSGFFRSKKRTFKTTLLLKDGIHYKAGEGNFYLPNAIIFYDDNDYPFPSTFYFIAQIGNEIELRKCNGGKGVQWFRIPDLQEPIVDQKIISKIEYTMLEIKKLVESSHNIKAEAERKEQQKANRPILDAEQKSGYVVLTELCLQANAQKNLIIEFIETLNSYDYDNDYLTTLNYVIHCSRKQEIPFIIQLDWKEEIIELELSLKSALKENYHLSIDLPNADDYEEDSSVSSDNVFGDFDKPLRTQGLQMGFIDTQSDEYVIILHKISDRQKIERAVNKIGYQYFEK